MDEVEELIRRLKSEARSIRDHVPDERNAFRVIAQDSDDPERATVAGPLHAEMLEQAAKALTVSPEKLEACAMTLGELHAKNKGYGLAFATDYARAAAIALGLRCT